MNSLRNKLSNRLLMQNGLTHLQSYSSAAPSSNIQIPNRKERGPTDILRALENTITKDPTAPHYKFLDDPFLIPMSNLNKRSYALAKEAGKKAAMWVRQEHAEFFQHRHAEPMIELFAPRAVYTDKSQCSEELLLNIIKSANVDDALKIYNLLECDVKIDTKLALFELLCFANSTQEIDIELIEERWFTDSNQNSKANLWKDSPEIESLFKTLVEEGGEIATAAYNALICGYAKHNNLLRAWELYEECKDKNIPINKTTYDHLIVIISYIKQQDNDRISLLTQMYQEMVEKNLKPDIKTFNASLNMALSIERNKQVPIYIFNEFKRINVKPSLGSYYYYLRFARKYEHSLDVVLNILEKEQLTLQSPDDQKFFVFAMHMSYKCESLILGKRLHDLLLKDNNYAFIGDSYQENVYYRYYLLLHLKTLEFESFMKVYEQFVPNTYTPEVVVFAQILDTLNEIDPKIGSEMLPFIFSQTITYDFMRNEEIVTKVSTMMAEKFRPEADSSLNKTFAINAWTAWNELKELQEVSRRGYSFVAAILEKLAVLCLRGEEFDQMLEILSVLLNTKNYVLGSMAPVYAQEIFDACLSRGHTEACLSLIDYTIEYGMDEGITMARKALSTLTLSPSQESKLDSIVGKQRQEIKSSIKES